MGIGYNPQISTGNLVFHIDGANRKSYPGTGNLIINLIDTTRTGNLANKTSSSTKYNSNNLGIMAFNGAGDYIDFGAYDLGIEAKNKTFCAWINPTSYPSGTLAPLVDRDEETAGYGFWLSNAGKLWFWPGTNIDQVDDGPYSAASNTWTHVAISYDISTNQCKFYYNGLLSSTKTALNDDVAPSATNRLCIGALRNRGEIGSFGTAVYQGFIASVSLYTKVLTQEEIIQNFNALRGRFGV